MLNNKFLKYRGDNIIFQFPSAISREKNYIGLTDVGTGFSTAETFVYDVGTGFSTSRHFAKGHDLFFLTAETLVLPKLYCLLITHLKR